MFFLFENQCFYHLWRKLRKQLTLGCDATIYFIIIVSYIKLRQ